MKLQVTVTSNFNGRLFVNRVEREVNQARRTAGELLAAQTRSEIMAVNAVASRSLLKSITTREQLTASAVSATEIFSKEPAAFFMEYGRRPGSKPPPVSVIEQWLKLKGIPGGRGLAFIIARSIGKRGWRGRFPFRRAVARGKERVIAIFRDAIKRVVDT